MLHVTHFGDPGCPWGYSAWPHLALLQWRYGDGLTWEHRMIGLAEDAQLYLDRGYTPQSMAQGYRRFRRLGMPFATSPRARVTATGRACRAIVATRLRQPELELHAFRALQLNQFTTTRLFDEDEDLRAGLRDFAPGIDADAVVAAIDSAEVEEAYQEDRRLARTASGSPTEFQRKSFNSDGLERYTAPSLLFTAQDGRRLEAGGFQSAEAYDVCVANLDRELDRRGPAPDAAAALAAFAWPLATYEVAVLLAPPLTPPDPDAAEAALIDLAAAGRVERRGAGHSALWQLTG